MQQYKSIKVLCTKFLLSNFNFNWNHQKPAFKEFYSILSQSWPAYKTQKSCLEAHIFLLLFRKMDQSKRGESTPRLCYNLYPRASVGLEPQKRLLLGQSFFCIFDDSGNNEAWRKAQRLYKAIITAHALGQHMQKSPGPELCSKCFKSVKIGCSC